MRGRRDAARTRPRGQFSPPVPCADRHAQSASDVDAPASLGGLPACGICPAAPKCPILANVQDLRLLVTRERIADVLAYSHFSGQRLTFRRMQAVLAMATTGGLRCSDVQSAELTEVSVLVLLRYRYYNALFLRDELRTPVAVRPEPIARSFTGADPGGFVAPGLDRRIADILAPQPDQPRWNERASMSPLEIAAILAMRLRLRPGGQSGDMQNLQADLSRLTRSLRRLAMFVESVAPDLRWRRALQLLAWKIHEGTVATARSATTGRSGAWTGARHLDEASNRSA